MPSDRGDPEGKKKPSDNPNNQPQGATGNATLDLTDLEEDIHPRTGRIVRKRKKRSFYGDNVYARETPKNNAHHSKNPPPAKSKSGLSQKSTSSQLRQKKAELDANDAVRALENQVDDLVNKLGHLEIDVERNQKEIETLEAEAETNKEDEDKVKELKAKISKLKSDGIQLTANQQFAKLEVEAAQKKLGRQIAHRSDVLAVVKLECEESQESESSDDSISDDNQRVQEWAETQQVIARQHIPERFNNNSQTFAQVSTSQKILARQTQGRELPIFSGRPEEWLPFLAAFNSTTDNCFFSNADNLPRLHKALKGDALKFVQHMLISPDSVPEIIDTLKMRYGQPEILIKSMMKKVHEAQTVREDRPETIIELGSVVSCLVSTIKATKLISHFENPSLLMELESKLPYTFRMSWVREKQGKIPDLQLFAAWYREFMEVACCVVPESKPKDERKEKKFSSSKPQKSFATVETKPDNSKSKTNMDRACVFCKEKGHRNHECPELTKLPPEDRWDFVRKNRACFGCLNKGHSWKECRSKKTCGVDNCTVKHHRVLHSKFKPKPKEEAETSEETEDAENVKHAAVSLRATGQWIHFMMAPITLKGPKGNVSGFAVLDSFSSITSIDETTAKILGVQGTPQPLEVEGFGAKSSYPDSKLVDIELIPDANKQSSFKLKGVRTVRNMRLPSQSLHKSELAKWKHLEGIQFPTYNNESPIILIGDDNAALSDVVDTRYHPNPNAPRGIETPLGWVLRGNLGKRGTQASCFQVRHIQGDEELHALVKQHFAVESLGLSPTAPKPRSSEDDRAHAIIDRTLKRVDGGFEIGLLWKEDDPILPRSYNTALSRLKLMEKKMDRDSEFAETYKSKIDEYVQKGFARKLSPQEVKMETKKTFYMPHFLAVNPRKQKKYRFVFDAAAKVEGRSLNDFLLRGPDNLVPLVDILMRFRQRPIAISADIRDMFHRVKIQESDRDAQRFLFRGMDRDRDPDVFQMEVMIFGSTCSPSCAQEAKNKNALDHQQQYPNAVIPITQLHYVDDYLNCHDTVEEAIVSQKEVREVHSKGGFHICNFLSNSKAVMESIPEDLRASTMKSMDLDSDSLMDRVLGLYWKQMQDVFTFSLKYLKIHEAVLTGERVPTKRELLSLVMSLYDPLGFLSHFTIKAKIILQQIWRTNTGWDQPIPDAVTQHWDQWRDDLKKVPEFEIPRCFSPNYSNADAIELHLFGDGSEEGYGAIGFLRIIKGDQIDIAFVISKAKVAPLKVISINRMELQAAVLCAKLKSYILATLDVKITRVYLWSDSANVLCWIRADGKKFQQFVGHRIGEIQELTEVEEWRWIPTDMNPADEMTRIATPCDLSKSSVRVTGPDFLRLPEEDWPIQKSKAPAPDQDSMEMRKQYVNVAVRNPFSFDVTRFSKWKKLYSFVGYMLRLQDRARKVPIPKTKSLKVTEIARAKTLLYKMAQEQSFSEELTYLRSNTPIPKQVGLHKIGLILDADEVLRVRGRLENSDLPFQTKHPIVLDRKHPVTRLIVQHYHELCGHHGHERIGNEIRQLFYIPSLRQEVRSTQGRCQACKNERVKPQVPEMGQLPTARLEKTLRPFINTGVDYFGPIEVIVKRSREKRYVALFTCLATRAIHLELAGSLSTDSFILALRRFVARRGCPSTLYSDNGTNFVGANRELKEALSELNQDSIENECTKQSIQWKFNPPAAPHMGGSWERMVRSTKVALGDTLNLKNLHEEPLRTLLCEAEHTVNSHPLTHVTDDPDDPEALTPNHFLIGVSSNLQPFCRTSPDDVTCRKQWRVIQQMAEHFWSVGYESFFRRFFVERSGRNRQNPSRLETSSLKSMNITLGTRGPKLE